MLPVSPPINQCLSNHFGLSAKKYVPSSISAVIPFSNLNHILK